MDGDKTNNAISNLRALCIGCHAEEPQHAWVKKNPDYDVWKRIYGRKVSAY